MPRSASSPVPAAAGTGSTTPSRRSANRPAEPMVDRKVVEQMPSVLVVGASGSIGRLAVAQAIRLGYQTKALVRNESQADSFPDGTRVVVGDLTRAETLRDAVAGVTGVVFTHGSHGDAHQAELVDYGAVRNVLSVLDAPARIALMTAIGVTKHTPGHDWKRRSERLVRASGMPYTIVRPGWFDYNATDQHRIVMLQGDRRRAGGPSDGVIARRQISEVLMRSLSSEQALRKTFELVAEAGPQPANLDALLAG